ncbi:unnamed protein product [Moneuplotes crassus]|uniref:Uncharacterized protein n=1 Tax=Euplotes crassus TaxID=5936 RepID=A0AAD1U6X6_EUPCR|nr:unnamed protein product [Moneuplotes crassus]
MNNYDDCMDVVYWKQKTSASKMIPTQLGVCGFKYEGGKLLCYPYNMYIYPLDHPAHRSSFITNVGSFNFLAQHNFDFNKWIYEGVGFFPEKEYQRYEEATRNAILNSDNEEFKNAEYFSNDAIIYCNSKFIEIRDWYLKSMKDGNIGEENELKINLTLTPYKYFHALSKKLPKMFPNIEAEGKKFETEVISDNFTKELYLKVKIVETEKDQDEIDKYDKLRNSLYRNLQQYLNFKKLRNMTDTQVYEDVIQILPDDSPQELRLQLKNLLIEDKIKLETILTQNEACRPIEYLSEQLVNSFPHREKSIVSLLSELHKPIITHNGMIDCLHLYDKFIDRLPSDTSAFKQNFSEAFPNLYDTKYILKSCVSLSSHFAHQRMTSLGQAYQIVMNSEHFSPNDHIEIADEIRQKVPDHEAMYEFNSLASHEAGYDAMMTGVLFHKLAKFISGSNAQLEDEFSLLNIMYKNRIPLARRTPINLNAKTTEGDGIVSEPAQSAQGDSSSESLSDQSPQSDQTDESVSRSHPEALTAHNKL